VSNPSQAHKATSRRIDNTSSADNGSISDSGTVTTDDPVLEEVRRARKLISDEIGLNLTGLVEHYTQDDSRFKAKAIDAPDRRTKHCTEVAGQPIPDGSSSPATRCM
jgi:hypothetical protein